MADFSDREDMQLVQLAKKSVEKHGCVDWNDIAFRMITTRKSKNKLLERLKTLKKRYGKDIGAFPARYFRPLPPVRVPKASQQLEKQPRQASNLAATSKLYDAVDILTQFNQALERLPPAPYTNKQAIFSAVSEIFAPVTKKDIRQPCGRVDYNTGEMAMEGVYLLVTNLGPIESSAVFVDIGAGVCNVVAQVALQAPFQLVVGVEIRADVLAIGRRLIDASHDHQHLLSRTRFVSGDVRSDEVANNALIRSATHLFSSNVLFAEDANHALEALCANPSLRVVAITRPFCSRHRPTCGRVFCTLWKQSSAFQVPVTYTSKLITLYVYVRRAKHFQSSAYVTWDRRFSVVADLPFIFTYSV